MTELAYQAFDFISTSNFELSLLHSADLIISLFLTFYINDFFDKFRDFENLFYFLWDHFFLRVE